MRRRRTDGQEEALEEIGHKDPANRMSTCRSQQLETSTFDGDVISVNPGEDLEHLLHSRPQVISLSLKNFRSD